MARGNVKFPRGPKGPRGPRIAAGVRDNPNTAKRGEKRDAGRNAAANAHRGAKELTQDQIRAINAKKRGNR